jgi:Leucine-rich repeat (LRR) protein
MRNIARATHLKHLSLDFEQIWKFTSILGGYPLLDLSLALGALKSLQSIELNLKHISLTSHSYFEMLFESMKLLPQLSKVKLVLSQPFKSQAASMGDLTLAKIAEMLENLTMLKELDLSINSWKDISDKAFKVFARSFAKLSNLRKLNLNLGFVGHNNERITSQTCVQLCNLLGHLPELTSLDLNLRAWDTMMRDD